MLFQVSAHGLACLQAISVVGTYKFRKMPKAHESFTSERVDSEQPRFQQERRLCGRWRKHSNLWRLAAVIAPTWSVCSTLKRPSSSCKCCLCWLAEDMLKAVDEELQASCEHIISVAPAACQSPAQGCYEPRQ